MQRSLKQNKYFQEQVLMKEELKVITKTHKGESVLTFEKETPNDEDLNFEAENKTNNFVTIAKEDDLNKENLSEKMSWDYYSDEEKTVKKESNISTQFLNLTKNASYGNSHSNKAKEASNTNNLTNSTLEIKEHALSQKVIDFKKNLDEYSRDALVKRFNDYLSILNEDTRKQIYDLRNNINV